jgi:predicted O-methyltransferase YrrM
MLSDKRGALSVGLSILKKHGIRGFSGAAFDYATRPILMPWAIRSLRSSARKAQDVDSLVDLVMRFRFGNVSVAPMQIRREITALCRIVSGLKPANVLEIGTAKGGTLFLFAQLAAPDAHLVSVDLPLGQFGGGYPNFKAPLYRSFARDTQRIDLIRADSHASETIARVTAAFPNGVDFLFIDGDHSLAGVTQDFDVYGRLVRPGGVVAFHDIVPGPGVGVGDVPRFWQDLKKNGRVRAEFVEFVEDWNQGGLGIGVLRDLRGF